MVSPKMAANRIFFDLGSEILFGKSQCSPLKAETNDWTLSQLLMKKLRCLKTA